MSEALQTPMIEAATRASAPAEAVVRRLDGALALILLVHVGVTAVTGLVTLIALWLVPEAVRSPVYYTGLQAAYRAIEMAGADSWDPMLAGLRWLRAHPGTDVYAAVVFGQGIKFQYPATSLLPLLALPDGPAAIRVLNAVNLAATAACALGMAWFTLALVRARLPGLAEQPGVRRRLAAVAAIGTLAFFPVLRAAGLGQVQAMLNALFVFACLAHLRGRTVLAGVLLGLSVLVKPQLALVFGWAALRREWRLLAGGVPVAAAGLLAAVLLFGDAWVGGYLRLLAHVGLHGESYFANQSVNGLMHRLLDGGGNLEWDAVHYAPYDPLVQLATLQAGAVFTVLGLAARRGTAGLVAAGICATMASPVAWEHHYGVLLPGFALLLAAVLDRPGRAWWGLAAAYLVAANVLSPLNWLAGTPLNPLQSYLFFAAVGVLALLLRLPAGERRAGAG